MQPEFKCLIIDDEPKAIDLLQQRLQILFPDIEIVGAHTEWQKGLEILRKSDIDILFLDISMPEKNGIDFLKLFQNVSFQVIFVTAHAEYAIDAIKFSATGYVLKPVDDYELSFAVNKALEQLKNRNLFRQQPESANNSNTMKIGVPNVKGIDYINLEDILYFESVNKYTKVVTSKYSIMSSYNLGEFKKIVDSNNFFQVHRSYIVNMHHIKRYEVSGMVIMEDNMQIPVSKGSRADFIAAFNKISRTAGIKNKDNE